MTDITIQTRRLMLGVAMLGLCTNALWAQESVTNTVASTNATVAMTTDHVETVTLAEVSDDVEGAVAAGDENLISIQLDDVAMGDVIKMFSRLSGANIIAPTSNIDARVSAKLDNVAWSPALISILSMHGMAMIENPPGSSVYNVVNRPPDAPEPLLVSTIFLQYATTDDLAPIILAMLRDVGTLSLFPSRNAMVLRTTESNLNEINEIIAMLDIQAQQVVVETQFLELNKSASEQLGIRWDGLEEFRVGFQAGPFTKNLDSSQESVNNSSLTRTDTRQNTDSLNKLYDMYNRQMQTESIEITERPDGSFIELRSIDPTRVVQDSIDLTQVAASEVTDAFSETITRSAAAVLNPMNLDVVMSALKKTDGVSIVSNPKIIVTSGETNAYFRVGDREPIIRTTETRGTQDNPGTTFTANLDTETNTEYIQNGYLSTGIELLVIPIAKTDDLIQATIVPSLRRKIGEKTVAGNSWPVISVKEIRTEFTLKSGQTVAIGGLTDTFDNTVESKIPILGSIPLLGKYLFSHKKDVKEQKETVIFVTLDMADPRGIIGTEGVPQRSELVYKQVLKMRAREEEFTKEIRTLREALDISSEAYDPANEEKQNDEIRRFFGNDLPGQADELEQGQDDGTP